MRGHSCDARRRRIPRCLPDEVSDANVKFSGLAGVLLSRSAIVVRSDLMSSGSCFVLVPVSYVFLGLW